MEGLINCKTEGGFLYLLWSKKAPHQQYLGSCSREPRERLGEHRRDIINGINKAIPIHFRETRSSVDDLVFVPFKRIRSKSKLVLKHFENKLMNEYNLVEAGITRILT